MPRSLLSSVLSSVLATGLVLSAAASSTGCLAAMGAGNVSASVGYRAVQPSLRSRRLDIDRPLAIHLTSAVQDRTVHAPAPGMSMQVDQFRATLGNALLHSFHGNFSAVSLAPGETRSGLELVVMKATIEPTSTISYHAILMLDGVELMDVAGQSEGRSITTGPGGYQQASETLLDEAVAKSCAAIYDELFYGDGADARIEKLQAL